MKRFSISLVAVLKQHRLRVFTTGDIQILARMTSAQATKALGRLAHQGLVGRLKRGVWANCLIENLNPYEAVPFLTAPWPAYVSLYSALADYGIVDEIPQVVYAVSSDRPKRFETFLANVHVHHLPEHLMWGYEVKKSGSGTYFIAEPEKAFLDLMYLALTPRSRLRSPTKREKRWGLDQKKVAKYAVKFKFKPLLKRLKSLNI